MLRRGGQHEAEHRQPNQAQTVPAVARQAALAVERPQGQRPGREGKPQQVFQIISGGKTEIQAGEAAERRERVIPPPLQEGLVRQTIEHQRPHKQQRQRQPCSRQKREPEALVVPMRIQQ